MLKDVDVIEDWTAIKKVSGIGQSLYNGMLESIGMDHVISELHCEGTILK